VFGNCSFLVLSRVEKLPVGHRHIYNAKKILNYFVRVEVRIVVEK